MRLHLSRVLTEGREGTMARSSLGKEHSWSREESA